MIQTTRRSPEASRDASTVPKSFYSITGLSVQYLDPQLSGRVMARTKPRERGFDITEAENSFLSIKKTFELTERRKCIEETLKETTHPKAQDEAEFKKLKKDSDQSRAELTRFLKQSFKHIEGMQHARKQGAGLSELERYDTI